MLTTGRYTPDTPVYTEMLTTAERFTDRIWAIEGCNGIGRHLTHRLVHNGETVINVPADPSAQVQQSKDRPVNAHSAALGALRSTNLSRV